MGSDQRNPSQQTYDALGWPYQRFDAARQTATFTDNVTEIQYNDRGYAHQWVDGLYVEGKPWRTYRTIESLDARGNVIKEQLGGGVIATQRRHDDKTGRITGITSRDAMTRPVQAETYTWDILGNLSGRTAQSGNNTLNETFAYDTLNRLIEANTDHIEYKPETDTTTTQTLTAQSVTYDAHGNVTHKSDVGDYTYDTRHPHAVSQTKQNGKAATRYYYDQQGNLTGDNRQRRLTYTPFNKVKRITKNTTTHIIDFMYGPDRTRFLRIDTSNTGTGASTTTTVYLGNVEHVIAGDKSSTYKRYLAGGSVLIIQDYDKQHMRTGEDTRYLLKDHLGSIARILDKHGTLDQSFSYDAWGERRSPDTAAMLASLTLTSPIHTGTTTRGYTGHEMLDAVGIIHMNGRIYDAKLGRFLQADPIVQFPDYTQSWNSYSYVLNNPLVYTDPTGYFIGKLFKKLFRGLNKAFGDFAPFVSIALLAIPGMPGWVMQSWGHAFGFGFVTGGIATGSLKGALFGGISAAAFYGIGEHFAAVTGLAEGGLGHILTHGLAGGILAELQGGQFGHGFLAAGLSKAVMGRFSYEDGSAQAVIGRTTIAAIVGGTVSRITGGKFANGAMTSAMAQLFNAETHARNSVTKISEAGLKHIMESEGYSATVYPDQAGHPTIGYGHKLTAAEMESGIYDNGITQVQAKKLLQQDLSAAVNAVGKNVTVPLAQNQFDALVSLTYNIGVGNFRSSTLLTQLNSGNYAGSANQFLSWNKITVGGVKTVSRGLTNRRLAEKCMFHGGC